MAAYLPTDLWRCSQCQYVNFSGTCPEKCVGCGHEKCSACTNNVSAYDEAFAEYNGYSNSANADDVQVLPDSSSKDTTYSEHEQSHNKRNYKHSSREHCDYYHAGYKDDRRAVETQNADQKSDPTLTPRYMLDDYPPDMTGYWVCHECRQTNGPVLNPEQCGNCGQFKNYCCSPA